MLATLLGFRKEIASINKGFVRKPIDFKGIRKETASVKKDFVRKPIDVKRS